MAIPGPHSRPVRWTDRVLGRPARPTGAAPAWLPGGADDLLLRAALRADDDGRSAWERFVGGGTTLDPEQERLLPLVARLRAGDATGEPLLDRGRALHRFTRARAHWVAHEAAPVLAALTTEAGPPLALKGLPLALLHYPDPGLRPLHDVDLLVRPPDFPAALTELRARGYTLPVPCDAGFVVDARGMDARAPEGGLDVDVHWQVHRAITLPRAPARWGPAFFTGPVTEDPVWGRSVALAVDGTAARAPSPADLLVHVVVHAATSAHRTLRWAADAAVLIGGDGVDWDVVVAETARRRVVLEVAPGLRYLAETLAVDVPPAVLARLDAAPVGVRQAVAHAARTGPPVAGRRIRRHLAHWVALTAAEPWTTAVAAAPRYARSLALRTRARSGSGASS